MNVKEFRKMHHLTQKEMGEILGVTARMVQKYESGATQLSEDKEYRLQRYIEANNVPPASSHDEATPVDDPEIVYLPIVPHSARAGTLGEYEQLFGDDYDRKQPVLVTKQMHGRYLCFRVEGDSMEPVLLHGDVVMARHIDRDLYKDSRLHLRSWSVWIVVTHHDGILIKSIADHDVEGGTLRLHSLNPLYPDQTVRMQDVIDVYNVIEIVSRHL